MKNLFYLILIFAVFFISPTMSAQTITGNTIICSSESFTASTWGANYQWVASPNLSLSNQWANPVTVSAAGSGAAKLSYLDNNQTVIKTIDIWVGVPVITSIDGPTSTPNYQYASYSAVIPYAANPTSYQWILNPQLSNNLYGASSSRLDIAFYDAGYYQLVVRAENSCGWGPYYVLNSLYVY